MRRCCFSQPWVQRTQAMAVVWIVLTPVAHGTEPGVNDDLERRRVRARGLHLAPATDADLDDDDLTLGIRFWEPSLTLTAGGGYRDNVAYSHAAPEGSAFTRAGLEATLIRLPFDGTQVALSLNGEDTRYLTSKSVDHEDTASAQGEIRRYLGDWQLGFGLEGGYLDQVVDLSITESSQLAVPVRGIVLIGRPLVRRDFTGGFWMSLELPGSRQYFDAPLDDYWELGPKFTLGQAFVDKSEVTLSYAFTHRDYDSQFALSLTGGVIPNLTRSASQHDAALVLKHYWDQKQRWRSVTRFSFRHSSDNASGYFDYRRVQVSEQLRFQTKVWLVNGEVRLGRYVFPQQGVDGPGTEPRFRTDLIFNARAEREIVKHLRLYAQFEHEQTFSNLKLDEYEVNTVSGGLMVEF
jgi:hypothetical protein